MSEEAAYHYHLADISMYVAIGAFGVLMLVCVVAAFFLLED